MRAVNEAEYMVCRKRGHSPSNVSLPSNPPWRVCKFCGVAYRFAEPELVEMNPPKIEVES